MNFVQEIITELYAVFKKDRGFDKNTFEKQMAVMRGQVRDVFLIFFQVNFDLQILEKFHFERF
jgi:hypothetical protein